MGRQQELFLVREDGELNQKPAVTDGGWEGALAESPRLEPHRDEGPPQGCSEPGMQPELRSGDSRSRSVLVVYAGGFLLCLFGLLLAGYLPLHRIPLVNSEIVSHEIEKFFSTREIHLPPELAPFAEHVEAVLPLERSNVFWNLNREALQRSLAHLPLLAEPRIERCSFFSFRCFRIQSLLRTPAMVAELGGQWWALDEEGRFLVPISPLELSSLPRLTGLEAYGTTPAVLQDVTAQLMKARDLFEEGIGRRVTALELAMPEALRITVEQSMAPFVLDPSDLSQKTLALLSSRARQLLELHLEQEIPSGEVGNSTPENSPVLEYDLRYEGMAVVKKNSPPDSTGKAK
ncbi:hypothetical protein MRY87_08190 [bacterium]|nr:hypothetical protein [bacterium]